MADQEDQKQLSRRARRRAAAAETDADRDNESEVDETPPDSDEAADERAPDSADSDDEDLTEAEAGADADDEAPAKLSKSEKKRAKQEEKSATSAVRDRNKRLRAEGAQTRRKKSQKRGKERQAAVARGLDASEMMDDAFARGTHAASQFIRKNFSAIQWVIVLGIAGGIGWQIYSWRSHKTAGKTSDGLMAGVDDELSKVGTEAANTEDKTLTGRSSFPTEEARLEAAYKAFEAAEKAQPGSGTSLLATLGRAGVLYDQGKYDEAKTAYEKVQASELAKHDADVRLRSLEGVGLCLEAKGDSDAAIKVFQELEKSDEPGFGSLGMYHQARVLVTKGEKDKAKELLGKVSEKLVKEKSPYQTASYVEKASRDLMAIIDPTTAPASGSSYSADQLDQMREAILKDPTKLKKMLEDMGKMKVPQMPDPGGAPMPLPEEPEPTPEPAPPASGAP
ncbi:MAG: tetratricopeptide repeat protein [Myxococcales bacterium]|nr:tetratricopeptide repeat protein [Myxococcales bacterium]